MIEVEPFKVFGIKRFNLACFEIDLKDQSCIAVSMRRNNDLFITFRNNSVDIPYALAFDLKGNFFILSIRRTDPEHIIHVFIACLADAYLVLAGINHTFNEAVRGWCRLLAVYYRSRGRIDRVLTITGSASVLIVHLVYNLDLAVSIIS